MHNVLKQADVEWKQAQDEIQALTLQLEKCGEDNDKVLQEKTKLEDRAKERQKEVRSAEKLYSKLIEARNELKALQEKEAEAEA